MKKKIKFTALELCAMSAALDAVKEEVKESENMCINEINTSLIKINKALGKEKNSYVDAIKDKVKHIFEKNIKGGEHA